MRVLPKQITLQNQIDDKGCVSACLAMLLNEPVDKIHKEFNDKYHSYDIWPDDFLMGSGLKVSEVSMKHEAKLGEGVYLVSVPSLNIVAGTHQIIFDYRGNKFKLYDPNKGRVNKKYYIFHNYDNTPLLENEVELNCFRFDYLIEDNKNGIPMDKNNT